MGIEIERKFLVNTMACLDGADHIVRIRQGYLSLDPDRTVRVRVINDIAAWITVKGRNEGAVRKEYEYRIPEQEGIEMLNMCIEGYIDKIRYTIPHNDLEIEVDVFLGDNIGLVVAEIEFSSAEQYNRTDVDVLPSWLGEEVTSITKYYNSNLIYSPYCDWNEDIR